METKLREVNYMEQVELQNEQLLDRCKRLELQANFYKSHLRDFYLVQNGPAGSSSRMDHVYCSDLVDVMVQINSKEDTVHTIFITRYRGNRNPWGIVLNQYNLSLPEWTLEVYIAHRPYHLRVIVPGNHGKVVKFSNYGELCDAFHDYIEVDENVI